LDTFHGVFSRSSPIKMGESTDAPEVCSTLASSHTFALSPTHHWLSLGSAPPPAYTPSNKPIYSLTPETSRTIKNVPDITPAIRRRNRQKQVFLYGFALLVLVIIPLVILAAVYGHGKSSRDNCVQRRDAGGYIAPFEDYCWCVWEWSFWIPQNTLVVSKSLETRSLCMIKLLKLKLEGELELELKEDIWDTLN
jgi:hypothetical protein